MKIKDSNAELETQIVQFKQNEFKFRGEIDRMKREYDSQIRQYKILDERKTEAEAEKEAAKSAVTALTREVEWLNKQTAVEKSDIMNLVRDRDTIQRTLKAVSDTNIKNRNEIIQKEQTIATTLE